MSSSELEAAKLAERVTSAIPFPTDGAGHDNAWWAGVTAAVVRIVLPELVVRDRHNKDLAETNEWLKARLKEILDESGR